MSDEWTPTEPARGEDAAVASFRDTLEAAGVDPATLELRPDGTVGPAGGSGDVGLLDGTPHANGSLPPLAVTGGTGELKLVEIIGEGGMGVVHAAEQASLRRTVAVKTLRPEMRTPARIAAFVREARVTGALEHPNVVPVHGLGVGEDGAPRIVMKRVLGRSWKALLHETRGQPDHLDRHLDVLLSVCHAMERAHDAGILHRDLKPENVLVGDYGEVLVVDWGLAVALRETTIDGLPRADEVRQVVGTPHYMAPEMAVGDGSAFGPPTDVYLLGATLHEILTGSTRHDGASLMATLYQAYASEPYAYGPEIPPELGAIANRACATAPSARYPDVASFRRALMEYRTHAGSRRLAEEAQRRLDAAEPDLAACRFGFEQALAAWPDNRAAQRGLADTLERIAERALANGAFDEARRALEELERMERCPTRDRARLRERLERLREELARRTARLRALERAAREGDLGVAADRRRAYGIAFGVLIALYNVALGALAVAGVVRIGHLAYVLGAAAVAAAVGGVAALRLRPLVPNRAARRLLWGLALILAAQVPVFLALGSLDIGVERALAVSLLQLGGSFLIKSVSLDPRVSWVGFATLLLGGVTFVVPGASWFAVGLAYGTFFVTGSLLRFEDEDGA